MGGLVLDPMSEVVSFSVWRGCASFVADWFAGLHKKTKKSH